MEKTKYLNWRIIEGYNCVLQIVLGERGMGKTFYPVFKHIKIFLKTGLKFVYLVDSEDSVKMLGSDRGAKFFSRILKFMKDNPSNSNKKYLTLMEKTEITTDDFPNKIIGGTIIIGGKTAGYVLSIDNFHKVKRNNFTDLSAIIVDEFVPEKVDIRTLQNPYKLNNIIQSIARTDNVKIYMLGNTVSLIDPIILRFKLHDMKDGEIRRLNVKNEHGLFLFAVAWRPDPNDYPTLQEEKKKSSAGLFSQLIGETNLEQNKFKNELPTKYLLPIKLQSSKFIVCIHGHGISFRVHRTKDRKQIYILTDYGKNKNNRVCLDTKFLTPSLTHYPEWKKLLLEWYSRNMMRFDNSVTYNNFKIILGIKQ